MTLAVVKCWESLRALAIAGDSPPRHAARSALIEMAWSSAKDPLSWYWKSTRGRDVAGNARIYAEIVGFGASSDAGHITQPSVDGPARAMRAALKVARLLPNRWITTPTAPGPS